MIDPGSADNRGHFSNREDELDLHTTLAEVEVSWRVCEAVQLDAHANFLCPSCKLGPVSGLRAQLAQAFSANF